MAITYILLGSNLGHTVSHCHTAAQAISEHVGTILASSKLYSTAPWGVTNQPHYTNQVLMVRTMLQPQELLDTLLTIEANMGRTRTTLYASRVIDLDILYYNQLIIHTPTLTIPHPHIASRRFVLVPLAQLVPNKLHPVYRITNKALLQACTDTLEVIEMN